jgi:succinate dehydrogenase / fumarate reductase membrane anchor subunit
MLAFVLAVMWHARLGLQVVIEDYIHTPWLEIALQVGVKFAYALAALASVVAIGRIAFTA